jgi:hypothetical protein
MSYPMPKNILPYDIERKRAAIAITNKNGSIEEKDRLAYTT